MSAFLDQNSPVGTVYYASFWSRAAAKAIDVTLLLVPVKLVEAFSKASTLGGSERAHRWLAAFAFVLLWFVYESVMESSRYQATLGKRALGIVVVQGGTNNRLSLARACVRSLVQVISVYFLAAGYLIALVTRRKQALHDLIVNSVVLPGTV